MIRVYVAGPYSADNVIDVLHNIGRGEELAAKVFAAGFAVFCPWHDKSYAITNWEHDVSVQQYYDHSIAWLDVSDCVILTADWKTSAGTLQEIKRAKKLEIPVFESIEALKAYWKS